MQPITLTQYLSKVCADETQYSGFDKVVDAVASGAVTIQKMVSAANLAGAVGATGEVNIQGEKVQILDAIASDTFVKTMTKCRHVAAIGCEEIKEAVFCDDYEDNSYIVQMDPLDGSSNIDVAISIGSIFGVWPNSAGVIQADTMLLSGNEQIAAIYTLYGSSTMFVLATKDGVQGFTLNPTNSKFELTHPDITLTDQCVYYSVNEGNFNRFNHSTQVAVTHLKNTLSLRYVGSLVADFHRNLLKGGIFLYPKDTSHPNGKLRLMYEANPLSFIIEQAGGFASSGTQRILDIQPKELHQRTPLILGNKAIVEQTLDLIAEKTR